MQSAFRDAIMRQLSMRIGGNDTQLTVSGWNAAQDYVLYQFTREDTNGNRFCKSSTGGVR